MSYIIRNQLPHQYQMVRNWGISDGANRGIYDHLAFQLLDKNSFWIGQLDGQPIAAVAFGKYDQTFGYVGLYFVKPQYRNQGYGIQLWKKALSNFRAQNIGLEGSLAQQKNYTKSGFVTHHKTFIFQAFGTNQKHQSPNLKDCRTLNIEDIANYDRKNFPTMRKEFVEKWINLPESKAIAFVENDQIKGYGVLRVSAHGYRLGPLFANSFQISDQIVKCLIGQAAQGRKIRIDIPQINGDALKLAQKYKMEKKEVCARMYTNGMPNIQNHKTVYGWTSLELG